MDPVISYILAGVIVVVLAAIVYQAFTSKKSNESEPAAVRPRVLPGAELREDLPAGARRRRAGAVDRLRRAREAEAARRQEEDSDASANEEGDLFDYIAQPEGKIGAKKMAKLEEKARKRADREAMERERAEQKEREALLEEERKKEEARLLRLEAKKVCRSVLFSDREISPLEV
ncbi:hypothetical protein EB796_020268 [Bugula neritina]|uniref:DDRGK domain-containing protein 1 n=1 Tax=Bugula neritina TaxID=10212 RepID=A0A7J7J5Y5_BUGNE|nr:hypothetical protein EB796_020268 [Bugula neritina]